MWMLRSVHSISNPSYIMYPSYFSDFRGQQAKFTFPTGVTTLSWFASPNGHARRDNGTVEVEVEHQGVKLPSASFVRVRNPRGAGVIDSGVAGRSDRVAAAMSHARALPDKRARRRLSGYY
jgi:hypothetical protein